MQKDFGPSSIFFVITGFFLGMLVMFISVGMRDNANHYETKMTSIGPNFEKQFLKNMITTNEQSLALAQEVFMTETPKRNEIFNLAQRVAESRKSENEQLYGWLHEWYGEPVHLSVEPSAEPVPAPVE